MPPREKLVKRLAELVDKAGWGHEYLEAAVRGELSDEEIYDTIDDLEAATSPSFVRAIRTIIDGLQNSRLDISQVKTVPWSDVLKVD